MRKVLLLLAACSVTACIEWPAEEEIRERRCSVDANDPGCALDAGSRDAGSTDAGSTDAGSTDAGSTDAGTNDAGVDAGAPDAGSWRIVWDAGFGLSGLFLVGDDTGGTFISQAAQNIAWREFTATGLSGVERSGGSPDYTAAYEREGTLVVAQQDGDLEVFARTSTAYSSIVRQTRPFIATAVDLYRLSDGGLAVAAYGNRDGGLAVESFSAANPITYQEGLVVPCTTTTLQPLRILPSPDAGPGVVVGNISGSCSAGLSGINSSGGFVALFGAGAPSGGAGYSFSAAPNSPMALGIVADALWVVYRAATGSRLMLANVPPTAPLVGVPLLLGNALTPVELLDIGTGSLLVGYGSGTISMVDGGSLTTMSGDDVFIARLNSQREVVDLQVFVAPARQHVVGAVWTQSRLVMGGNCDGDLSLLCHGLGSWIVGLEPTIQP